MFPFYNNYPGTDLHEIDLAYILKLCAELRASNTALTAWKAQHEAEYAELANEVEGLINNLVDVISPWDSSIAYNIFSIVEYQGTNYIAVQDVPVGTMITNTDYWQPANTVIEQINAMGLVVTEANTLAHKADKKTTVILYEDPYTDITSILRDYLANYDNVLILGGPYNISSQITIPTHKKVIGNGAAIYADATADYAFVVGTTSTADRFPRTEIAGLNIDCVGFCNGLKIVTGRASVHDISIRQPATYGINLFPDVSGAIGDCDITNIAIIASADSETTPIIDTGIYVNASDCTMTDIRTLGTKNGIVVMRGGNYLTRCHVLAFNSELSDWENSIGIDIRSNCFISNCYSDNFRYGLYIRNDSIVSGDGFYALWYETNSSLQRYAVYYATRSINLFLKNIRYEHSQCLGLGTPGNGYYRSNVQNSAPSFVRGQYNASKFNINDLALFTQFNDKCNYEVNSVSNNSIIAIIPPSTMIQNPVARINIIGNTFSISDCVVSHVGQGLSFIDVGVLKGNITSVRLTLTKDTNNFGYLSISDVTGGDGGTYIIDCSMGMLLPYDANTIEYSGTQTESVVVTP